MKAMKLNPSLLLVALLFAVIAAARAEWHVWTLTETRHVLRSEPPANSAAVKLGAARNEWVSFQILLRSACQWNAWFLGRPLRSRQCVARGLPWRVSPHRGRRQGRRDRNSRFADGVELRFAANTHAGDRIRFTPLARLLPPAGQSGQ